MLILTTEQIFPSPWHAVGLQCNSHSQMLPGWGGGSAQRRTQSSRGEAEAWSGMQMPTGREPILKFERKCLPASLWRVRRPLEETGASRKPEDFSARVLRLAPGPRPGSPWGSAFLNALPASTKQVAASCLLWSCRCSWAAWQNALPAAGTEKSELSLSGALLVGSCSEAALGGGSRECRGGQSEEGTGAGGGVGAVYEGLSLRPPDPSYPTALTPAFASISGATRF